MNFPLLSPPLTMRSGFFPSNQVLVWDCFCSWMFRRIISSSCKVLELVDLIKHWHVASDRDDDDDHDNDVDDDDIWNNRGHRDKPFSKYFFICLASASRGDLCSLTRAMPSKMYTKFPLERKVCVCAWVVKRKFSILFKSIIRTVESHWATMDYSTPPTPIHLWQSGFSRAFQHFQPLLTVNGDVTACVWRE